MQITIENFKLNALIGVYPHEKIVPQPIVINLQFTVTEPTTDALAEAIDYTAIAKLLETTVANQHFHLIEYAAQTLLQQLITQFGQRHYVLTLKKPNAIPKADSVSVTLEHTPP